MSLSQDVIAGWRLKRCKYAPPPPCPLYPFPPFLSATRLCHKCNDESSKPPLPPSIRHQVRLKALHWLLDRVLPATCSGSEEELWLEPSPRLRRNILGLLLAGMLWRQRRRVGEREEQVAADGSSYSSGSALFSPLSPLPELLVTDGAEGKRLVERLWFLLNEGSAFDWRLRCVVYRLFGCLYGMGTPPCFQVPHWKNLWFVQEKFSPICLEYFYALFPPLFLHSQKLVDSKPEAWAAPFSPPAFFFPVCLASFLFLCAV